MLFRYISELHCSCTMALGTLLHMNDGWMDGDLFWPRLQVHITGPRRLLPSTGCSSLQHNDYRGRNIKQWWGGFQAWSKKVCCPVWLLVTTCGMVASVKKVATQMYKHTMGREKHFGHVRVGVCTKGVDKLRGWDWGLGCCPVKDTVAVVLRGERLGPEARQVSQEDRLERMDVWWRWAQDDKAWEDERTEGAGLRGQGSRGQLWWGDMLERVRLKGENMIRGCAQGDKAQEDGHFEGTCSRGQGSSG